MEIFGILLKKSETKVISDTFSVQEFYLDASTFNQFTGEKYENIVKLQVSNAKIKDLEPYKKGDRLKISFEPRGRFYDYEGEKRHAQNLNAWRIEKVNQQGSYTLPPDEQTTSANVHDIQDLEDDLPF